MLKIIAADAAPTPSRAWAEEAWRQNPGIHASWWLENVGFTHSKLIYDARQSTETILPKNVNCVLTAGQHVAYEEGVVRVAVVEDPARAYEADVLLWQPALPLTQEACIAACLIMEEKMRQGEIAAYGVADALLGTPQQSYALHEWLAFAAEAAAQVWGRPKRPMLRVLRVAFDALNTAPLFYASTLYKERAVSLLEHAATLGLWVITQPTSFRPPESDALKALEDVAQAEGALNNALQNQWPHMHGQPVFAVLPLLQQGVAPWRHRTDALAWLLHVWPMMKEAFQSIGTPEADHLCDAWQKILPHITTLADTAATAMLERVFEQQSAQLPAEFAQQGTRLQHIAVCAAVAGIGGVICTEMHTIDTLSTMPDIADIGPFFMR